MNKFNIFRFSESEIQTCAFFCIEISRPEAEDVNMIAYDTRIPRELIRKSEHFYAMACLSTRPCTHKSYHGIEVDAPIT